MGRLLYRLEPFGPALIALLAGVMFMAMAGGARTLECDRASARCSWSTHSTFGGSSHREFALTDVREVRLVDKLGKHNKDARPVLVFASGEELGLYKQRRALADARYQRLRAFFAGAGDAVRDHEEHSRLWFFVAAACGLAAIGFAVRTIARGPRPPYVERSRTAGAPGRARRVLITIAAVVLGSAAIMGAMWFYESRRQGRLELDCRSRCRFDGLECLPGGHVDFAVDPGEHTVEVWAASGEALWQPHAVTIRVGETTRFVCAP